MGVNPSQAKSVCGKCGENYTEDYTDIVIVTSCVTRVVSNDVVSCVGSLFGSLSVVKRNIKLCILVEKLHVLLNIVYFLN